MSLRHPDRVKMSKRKISSREYFLRLHNEHCSGKFTIDLNYKGIAMSKAQCTQCGSVGFVHGASNTAFEGYVPERFFYPNGRTEDVLKSEIHVFTCKECGEMLDAPMNQKAVLCPTCGTSQHHRDIYQGDSNKPVIYNRARMS